MWNAFFPAKVNIGRVQDFEGAVIAQDKVRQGPQGALLQAEPSQPDESLRYQLHRARSCVISDETEVRKYFF